MEHVGIVVDDMEAAVDFFVALGLELEGEGEVEGEWVDRVIGVEGTRSQIAMLKSPDGSSSIELSKFLAPETRPGEPEAPTNTLGLRHLSFLVDDVDETLGRLEPHGAEMIGAAENYRDIYRLCYVRGPAGTIVELAEKLS
jgi:catechol 2,3-dioxygenase-like lactoylglutathione lyase family enzyme